jgi:hypothetical protein
VSTRIALLLWGIVASLPLATAHADDLDAPTNYGEDRPPCPVDSDGAVGYRRCPRYGAWGASLREPYVVVADGINYRVFAATPSAPVAARTTSPVSMKPGKRNTALTFDERIGWGITHHFYAALDFELGNLRNVDVTQSNERDFIVDGLLSAGIRAGIGPFAVAVELSGGAMESSYPRDRDVHVDGMVEARGRADIWLAPWFTLGGAVGVSLVEHGDWMAGVYASVHSWAFAGDRW